MLSAKNLATHHLQLESDLNEISAPLRLRVVM